MKVFLGLGILLSISTAATAGAPVIAPGLWKTTMRMSFAPNAKLPPQMIERMNQPRVHQQCITPEMAARANADQFRGEQAIERRNCSKSGPGFNGGRVDETLTCQSPRGGTMVMHMTGTYTPVATHMVNEVSGTSKYMMMQKVTIDSQRIGNCTK